MLDPSDATSTAALVAQMAELSGVSYLRTTRGGYPVLYGPEEEFPVGGSKPLRSSPHDAVTLIGAGVTLGEGRRERRQLRIELGVLAAKRREFSEQFLVVASGHRHAVNSSRRRRTPSCALRRAAAAEHPMSIPMSSYGRSAT